MQASLIPPKKWVNPDAKISLRYKNVVVHSQNICMCISVATPYLPCGLLPEGIQKSVGMEKFRQVQSALLQQCTCMALLFPCSKSKGLGHKGVKVECGVIRSFPQVVPGQWNLQREHQNNVNVVELPRYITV